MVVCTYVNEVGWLSQEYIWSAAWNDFIGLFLGTNRNWLQAREVLAKLQILPRVYFLLTNSCPPPCLFDLWTEFLIHWLLILSRSISKLFKRYWNTCMLASCISNEEYSKILIHTEHQTETTTSVCVGMAQVINAGRRLASRNPPGIQMLLAVDTKKASSWSWLWPST